MSAVLFVKNLSPLLALDWMENHACGISDAGSVDIGRPVQKLYRPASLGTVVATTRETGLDDLATGDKVVINNLFTPVRDIAHWP